MSSFRKWIPALLRFVVVPLLACFWFFSLAETVISLFGWVGAIKQALQMSVFAPLPHLLVRFLARLFLFAILLGLGLLTFRNRKTIRFFIQYASVMGDVLWVKLRKVFYTTPLIGEINNHFVTEWQCTPVGEGGEFGVSCPFPFAVEITIDNMIRDPGGVGYMVKNIFFKDHEPIFFNVCFACGREARKSLGYADPASIWYNIFFGYYQIDMAVTDKRNAPFGYQVKQGGKPGEYEINKREILSMAKADWNYFSNYLNGVPEQTILDSGCNEIDSEVPFVNYEGRTTINRKYWDVVRVGRIKVISGYEDPKKKERIHTSDYQAVWDECYDPYPPKHAATPAKPNFFPITMAAKFYMFHEIGYDDDAGQEVYRTFFFGGTQNLDYPDTDKNDRFLKAQLKIIQNIIQSKYPSKGFSEKTS